MNDYLKVFSWRAGYSRVGHLALSIEKCERCQRETVCLHFDESEGEYGGVDLCQDCLNELFQRKAEVRQGGAA